MSLTCEEVELAIVNKERDERVEAHLRECARCRKQDLGGVLREAAVATPDERPGMSGRELKRGEMVYGRYRILRRLGSGGQGAVYLAEDHEYPERPRQVALKLVRTDAREAAFALEVQHPNVCRLFHTEMKEDGVRLILMEYVGGGTLGERKRTLTRAQALRCFRRICQGVEAAHRRGVLHLDLKPQNVLLREDGEPAVTDFGLASALDETGQGDGVGGTWHFMAPEQKRREKVDRRTDVYALGVMLREMLGEGWSPYGWIARRATSEQPQERFQSAAALRRAVAGVGVAGRVAVGLAVAALLARPVAGAAERWWGCASFDGGRVESAEYQRCVRALPLQERDEVLLAAAQELRREYERATSPRNAGSPAKLTAGDMARTGELADFLLAVDPVNGHGLSYAGQVSRWINAHDRAGDGYLRSHERFYQYLEREKVLPQAERDGARAKCFERASGYCAERTNWILHLMANDNFRVACRAARPDQRLSALKRAQRQVEALRERRGRFDAETQGIPTVLLEGRIAAELAGRRG